MHTFVPAPGVALKNCVNKIEEYKQFPSAPIERFPIKLINRENPLAREC